MPLAFTEEDFLVKQYYQPRCVTGGERSSLQVYFFCQFNTLKKLSLSHFYHISLRRLAGIHRTSQN